MQSHAAMMACLSAAWRRAVISAASRERRATRRSSWTPPQGCRHHRNRRRRQDEVEIVRTADISIVTLVPGAGDDVQALKAGIMEIADVFVVKQIDRDGADRLVSAVESNLSLHEYGPGQWRPPIVRTVATTGEGVPELVEAIRRFREHSQPGSRRDGERAARREFGSSSRTG